ncbi:histone acetyltransferase MYST1 [Loa loa]|uniref:Histone acetyltransferase n=1 Tax=Loa loa TaxID=7209 RepID=A0A1I7V6F8_LOALO|nr:histone acetyltransferase MYST1 [Loa loa]EFO19584.1 histone acetyltransferase MYST1 [Loa loa]
MSKRSKKDRSLPPAILPPESLTPSTVLKVGETFIVLRRAPNKNGVTDERCLATVVEIREGEQASTSSASTSTTINTVATTNLSSDDMDVRKVCTNLLNDVSGEDVPVEVDIATRKEQCKMYYVHYDGMDRRLDEWVGRNRIVARANPNAFTSVLSVPSSLAGTLESGTLTRSQRRIHEEFNHVQKSYEDMDATTAKLEKEHAEMTKVKNIDKIRYGDYEIDAWYVSPYPDEYSKAAILYICEYCLAYMRSEAEYCCHMLHYCDRRQPPGDEIYRDGNLSVYEVDGKANKAYCQCLCLLSKLFLDHKTLFFDVETFLFYVLCEVDEVGAHVVGHFSKERLSANNLACIMVLPPFQRKGYGKLLIQLSYELSSREGVIGTPEKPLSDLGKVSYRSYWWWILLEALDRLNIDDVTVSDLSSASGVAEDDIISTLQTMQLIKYWKGDHVVRMTRRLVEHCKSINMGRPPKLLLDPDLLRWWPKKRRQISHRDRD